MSIYAIGFVIAVVIYLYYVTAKQNKTIDTLNLIIAIILGLMSWFGVIIMLLVLSFTKKN